MTERLNRAATIGGRTEVFRIEVKKRVEAALMSVFYLAKCERCQVSLDPGKAQESADAESALMTALSDAWYVKNASLVTLGIAFVSSLAVGKFLGWRMRPDVWISGVATVFPVVLAVRWLLCYGKTGLKAARLAEARKDVVRALLLLLLVPVALGAPQLLALAGSWLLSL